MENSAQVDDLIKKAMSDEAIPNRVENWGELKVFEGGHFFPSSVAYKLYYLPEDFFPSVIRVEANAIDLTPDEDKEASQDHYKFSTGMRGVLRLSHKINEGEKIVVKIIEVCQGEKVAATVVERPQNLPICPDRSSIETSANRHNLAFNAMNKAPWPIFIGLIGFSSPVDLLKLDEEIAIVKFTPIDMVEVDCYLGSIHKTGQPFPYNLFTHVITFNKLQSKPAPLEIPKLFEPILIALRLFKPGYVDLGIFLWFGEKEYSHLTRDTTPYKQEASTYRIVLSEVDSFKAFYIQFRELYPIIEKSLAVPIERFMSSYRQASSLNQLLDIVIGLESLFSEGPESLIYKYALRGGFAIGRTKEERINLNEKLKVAYKIRSTVAHGDLLERKFQRMVEDQSSFDIFILELRQTLAKAIILFANWFKNTSGSRKDFLVRIDEAMLSADYEFVPTKI